MTIAVVGCGWDHAIPVVAPYEYPLLVVAFVFLLAQMIGIGRLNQREWYWLGAGAGAYYGIAYLSNLALDTPLQSLVFLALIAVNLWLVFSGRFPYSGRLVFLDMTLCFCLSYLVIPGRLVMFSASLIDHGPQSNYWYYRECRILLATVINAVSLLTMLVSYWLAVRLRRLGPSPKRHLQVSST
ncbi:MAG: hypothetical protein PHU85_09950 [Phycisphaerae bacterium]|nr:hypothetical protein [Phycisphaerae bacterium]